jgi:hypothetical protein
MSPIFYCLRFDTSLFVAPTTRKVTVELFYPTSTRVVHLRSLVRGKIMSTEPLRNRQSAVGIATGYGLDDRGGRWSSSDRVKDFLHVVLTGSEVHTACYPVGSGGKAAGA